MCRSSERHPGQREGTVTSKNIKVTGGSIAAVQGELTVTQGALNDDCGTGKPVTFYGAFTTNGRSVMLLISVGVWPGESAPDASSIN